FNSWKILSDLIEYGPTYFCQFKDHLGHPESVEMIPMAKTKILASQAMDISNSTVSGNINSVLELLKQGNIEDPAECDPLQRIDVSEYIVLFHSDLGTGEHLQAALQQCTIKNTPWNHLQHVIFIPSLFHLKMASIYGLKPGFHRMHQLITHSGICWCLDCWRVQVKKNESSHVNLDAFAASEPLFDNLLAMADVIAKDYVADYRLRRMRSKDVTQHDGENKNALLLNKYMLLYEELSYAMNIGDIGQVEMCVVSEIS
ncbi:hypothetical protein BD769DRAFT_1350350, partial [Suillus cothurnatus]